MLLAEAILRKSRAALMTVPHVARWQGYDCSGHLTQHSHDPLALLSVCE